MKLKSKMPDDMLTSIIENMNNKRNSCEFSPNNQEAADPTE